MSKHTCHFPPCEVEIPRKLFMCPRHWKKLPKAIRAEIWREYNPGQEEGDAPVTQAYLDATDRAIKYLWELASKQETLF